MHYLNDGFIYTALADCLYDKWKYLVVADNN